MEHPTTLHESAAVMRESRCRPPVSPLDVAEVQRLLGPDEALFEYFLTRDRLTLFLITAARVAHFQQAIGDKELRAKVKLFRDRLRPEVSGQDDWRQAAGRLTSC